MRRSHWLHEPITTDIDTTLGEITQRLPGFDRSPVSGSSSKDLIQRVDDHTPVALVSRSYALVQHAQIADIVLRAARATGLEATKLPARLLLSELGTRMHLRVNLPDEFSLDPGDGHPMALTIECSNSVDGTVPLSGALGWFRLVCSNGMAVRRGTREVRRRHTPTLALDEFEALFSAGIQARVGEQARFGEWLRIAVDRDTIAAWVDATVADAWGRLAAARVFSIAMTGWDGPAIRNERRVPPHQHSIFPTVRVPGAEVPCRSVYGGAQALSWVASRRTNLAERGTWKDAIDAMIGSLVQLAS